VPGEKTFVDWAGDTVPIHDRESGETAVASIFVAVLGASTYTFVRAALGQGLSNSTRRPTARGPLHRNQH